MQETLYDIRETCSKPNRMVGCFINSQAVIIKDNKILMVRQYVERGDIVWNFPGGGIEEGESPEYSCVREVKEETGYDVEVRRLLCEEEDKYTYIVEIVDGKLQLDKNMKYDEDIIEVAWINVNDEEKFDTYTRPIMERLKREGIL